MPEPRLTQLQMLWRQAESIWEESADADEFRNFVASNYQEIYEVLVTLKTQGDTFLEWGSGLGVVTIMASLLGFEAYGIEIEPALVKLSRRLASEHNSPAQFVVGSFVPAEYVWNPTAGDSDFRTSLDGEPGYDALAMDLADFDVVFAYPWPDELELFQDIMKSCATPGALFLSYDAREGPRLIRLRSKVNR